MRTKFAASQTLTCKSLRHTHSPNWNMIHCINGRCNTILFGSIGWKIIARINYDSMLQQQIESDHFVDKLCWICILQYSFEEYEYNGTLNLYFSGNGNTFVYLIFSFPITISEVIVKFQLYLYFATVFPPNLRKIQVNEAKIVAARNFIYGKNQIIQID